MRAAGIRRYSDPVQPMELPGPGDLRPDEVLIEVRSAGVGNWDEIARTGGWDLGRQPPVRAISSQFPTPAARTSMSTSSGRRSPGPGSSMG